MPGGRPSKYKEEYCDALIKHMKKGYSYESFAGIISVNPDTLAEWCKVHPRFSEAKSIGRAAEQIHWEKLYNRAALGFNKMIIDGVEVDIKPVPSLIIFKMKNAFGWREINEDNDKATSVTINYIDKK